jgi:hypothetical protein
MKSSHSRLFLHIRTMHIVAFMPALIQICTDACMLVRVRSGMREKERERARARNQTRRRKDFAACAARSRLLLALHAQCTVGLLHVARSAQVERDTRGGQEVLARRHADGPLYAALLKAKVIGEA